MSITPKQKIGNNKKRKFVADKQFTDRVLPRKAFSDQISKIDNEQIRNIKKHHVLTYYGIGGIGKSRLQNELKKMLDQNYDNAVYTSIDLADIPVQSSAKILLELSKSFSDSNVELFHFSLAYAIYFQKANKDILYNNKKMIISENLGLVADFLGLIDGLGIVGIIPDVVNKIYEASYRKFNLDKEIKEDLQKLESMRVSEIEKMLPAFFAYDINKYLNTHDNRILTFFIDTYEALCDSKTNSVTKFSKDQFLRELIAHLPGVLFVICSREYIDWEMIDDEWGDILEQHLLDYLSNKDADEFLIKCKISETDVREKIIKVSSGHPYHLDLLVDTYVEMKNNEIAPKPELFASNKQEILECFFKYLHTDEISVIKIMSVPRFYNFALFKFLLSQLPTGYPITMFDDFNKFSFVTSLSNGCFHIHEIMRKELVNLISTDLNKDINKLTAKYYKMLLASTDITYEDRKIYTQECIYHCQNYLTKEEYLHMIKQDYYDYFLLLQFKGESTYLYNMMSIIISYVGMDIDVKLYEIYTDMIMLNGNFKEAVKHLDSYLKNYSISDISGNRDLLQLYVKKLKHQMIYLPLNETIQLLNNIKFYIDKNIYPHQYAEVLYTEGNMLLEKGLMDDGKTILDEVISIAQNNNLQDIKCRALRKIADYYLSKNDVFNADESCHEGLLIATNQNYDRYGNYLECTQAEIYRRLKLFEKARKLFIECQNKFKHLGIDPWIAHTELGLALIELEQGDYDKVMDHVEAAQNIYKKHFHKWGEIHSELISIQCDYFKTMNYDEYKVENLMLKCKIMNYESVINDLNNLKNGLFTTTNLLFL